MYKLESFRNKRMKKIQILWNKIKSKFKPSINKMNAINHLKILINKKYKK